MHTYNASSSSIIISVSLNAELIRWVREGEDVSIHCRAAKVGENLGFADMYLFDANGREVKPSPSIIRAVCVCLANGTHRIPSLYT